MGAFVGVFRVAYREFPLMPRVVVYEEFRSGVVVVYKRSLLRTEVCSRVQEIGAVYKKSWLFTRNR